MKNVLLACVLAFACTACSKGNDPLPAPPDESGPVTTVAPATSTVYTIKKGEHSSDGAMLNWIDTAAMHFSVRFDSSAVYTTQDKQNQYDINKLYGFADNGAQHHQYSARFGWRWSGAALRLFAYVYNAGVRQEAELTTVPIGPWIQCAISVQGNEYVFVVNDLVRTMPRTSTTPKAAGYMLYPYFGGDEVAPHDVRIEIRNR